MEISQIIAAGLVESRFQPIVELEHGAVIAHEALSRGPAGTPPRALFARAAAEGCEGILDAHCREMALRRAAESGWAGGADGPLFLNVRAGSVDDPAFLPELLDALAQAGRAPGDVVLEVSEAERAGSDASVQARLAECRAAGFWIALDDAGGGQCALRAIAEVEPHIVKIDRALVGGMDAHRGRRMAVSALAHLARELGILLVAEGIETEGELRTARELGVTLGQGFLLGRPGEGILPPGSVAAAVHRITSPGRRQAGPVPRAPLIRAGRFVTRSALSLAS